MGTSIKEIVQKIKAVGGGVLADRELFPALLIVTVGVASFGLGRLSVVPPAVPPGVAAAQLQAGESGDLPHAAVRTGAGAAPGAYVASRESDKYHLPWCSGARRISEANKIWFADKGEAEAAGYTPAGNCDGI